MGFRAFGFDTNPGCVRVHTTAATRLASAVHRQSEMIDATTAAFAVSSRNTLSTIVAQGTRGWRESPPCVARSSSPPHWHRSTATDLDACLKPQMTTRNDRVSLSMKSVLNFCLHILPQMSLDTLGAATDAECSHSAVAVRTTAAAETKLSEL